MSSDNEGSNQSRNSSGPDTDSLGQGRELPTSTPDSAHSCVSRERIIGTSPPKGRNLVVEHVAVFPNSNANKSESFRVDNEDESNSNPSTETPGDDGMNSSSSSATDAKSKSKPKRPSKGNPKSAVTASSAILEAKRAAQAQKQRTTRNSAEGRNSTGTVGATEPVVVEQEFFVMRDYLQPV